MADDRDRLSPAARLDFEDTEAALRVVKHDPLDQPGQNLAGLACLRHRLRHPLMMTRGLVAGYRMSWPSGAPSPPETTRILIGAYCRIVPIARSISSSVWG